EVCRCGMFRVEEATHVQVPLWKHLGCEGEHCRRGAVDTTWMLRIEPGSFGRAADNLLIAKPPLLSLSTASVAEYSLFVLSLSLMWPG
ncbi:mCG146165, isoform CRA_a, partial [Mus musculus]